MEQTTQQQDVRILRTIGYWIDKIQPESLRSRIREIRANPTGGFSCPPEDTTTQWPWTCFDFLHPNMPEEGEAYWINVMNLAQMFDGNVGDPNVPPVRYATDNSEEADKLRHDNCDLQDKLTKLEEANKPLAERVMVLAKENLDLTEKVGSLERHNKQLIKDRGEELNRPDGLITLSKSFILSNKEPMLNLPLDTAKTELYIVTNKALRGDGQYTPYRRLNEFYDNKGNKIFESDSSHMNREEFRQVLLQLSIDGKSLFTGTQVASIMAQVYK